MTAEVAPPAPPPEPLFTLDLQDNGGLFAPTSAADALTWMHREQQFWAWLQNRNGGGNHDQGLRQALSQLNQAMSEAQQAVQHKDVRPQNYQGHVTSLNNLVQDVFARRRLPHSSTPLAQRIDAYRQSAGEQAASFFAAVFIPPQQGHHFEPRDLAGWRGLTAGLIERDGLLSAPAKGRKQAAEQSFEQLRVKAEALLGEKSTAYDALHRDYAALVESVNAAAVEQKDHFAAVQTERASSFDALVAKHEQEMETLRNKYDEAMALRAPVQYWNSKRKTHRCWSIVFGVLSFAGIAGAAGGLAWLVQDLLRVATPNAQPEAWRFAMLVLMGVFAVWGVRLVVRMFLSHLHLATDAAERVVMTSTYLSLLDGGHLASSEDRQLILQALFRPASDGIVKDEGVPFSLAEVLTRTGKP